MRKYEELTNPDSCMVRAREDEMAFVLLGRDVVAPAVIREWCRLRCLHGKNTPRDAQITEALMCADAMQKDYESESVGVRPQEPDAQPAGVVDNAKEAEVDDAA